MCHGVRVAKGTYLHAKAAVSTKQSPVTDTAFYFERPFRNSSDIALFAFRYRTGRANHGTFTAFFAEFTDTEILRSVRDKRKVGRYGAQTTSSAESARDKIAYSTQLSQTGINGDRWKH